MEAIIRHSPIPHNGPIYSTYGNSPYLVRVYCTCYAKGSKAKSGAAHADAPRLAPGDSAFQFWQPAMSTCAFPFAHRKKRDCLSFPPVSSKLTVAALRYSSSKSISWEAV